MASLLYKPPYIILQLLNSQTDGAGRLSPSGFRMIARSCVRSKILFSKLS
jgi:hypothetical protein